MVEGKGKTYRSTSSPLSFSILSEVGRGGLWGVWLRFAAMLLAEERFGVWSRLAAWHFQPYGKCCLSYLRWISILNNSQRNIDFYSLSTWASASLIFHRCNALISDLRYTFHELPNDPPAFPFRKDLITPYYQWTALPQPPCPGLLHCTSQCETCEFFPFPRFCDTFTVHLFPSTENPKSVPQSLHLFKL